jgi:hypothetical protein
MRLSWVFILVALGCAACGAKPPAPPPPPPPAQPAPPPPNPCDNKVIDPAVNPCSGAADATPIVPNGDRR